MSRTTADTIATLSAMLPLLERGYLGGDLSATITPLPGGVPVQCYCLIGAVAEVTGELDYTSGVYTSRVDWGELAPGAMRELAATIQQEHPGMEGFDTVSTVWRYNDRIAPGGDNNELTGNEARIKLVRATIKRLQDSQESNHE